MYEVLSCALKPHCPESLVFRCSLHPHHVPSAVLDGRYKGQDVLPVTLIRGFRSIPWKEALLGRLAYK